MDQFYRMTPLEVASGWVAGYEKAETHASDAGADPLAALENLLSPPLESPPCFVEFSGGRDSSALLAVAVNVARRHGLALPVPITRIFPDVPESREDDWQEEVVRHLGLSEWHRIEYTDEFDLLGPTAMRSLRQHGLIWPATIHTRALVWEAAGGGTVVSGEGGDEVFGRRRISPLAGLLAKNVHPRKRAVAMTLEAFAPRPIRRSLIGRDLRQHEDRLWLREDAQREFRSKLIEDRLTEPLWWDHATRRHRHRRADWLGIHNLRLSAAMIGVSYLAPFHDVVFLDALANRGGRLGFPGRSAAMRDLFGELLPRKVLERESKAEFTRTFVCRESRSFMVNWNGDGLENDLVDAEALKREWEGERPHAGTLPLLQAAWLALGG
ncbi:MAG: asparagine synthase-related protein [Acidimicrobiia bacterium]